MKKILNILGAWMIAMALLTINTSCTQDNENNQVITPATPGKVHITVGAGLDNDTKTRSAVEESIVDGKTRRTLTFTSGDRLYVRTVLETGDDYKPTEVAAGYLDMVGTPASGATSATFSGDLTIYKVTYENEYSWVGTYTEDTEYTISEGTDPLEGAQAWLVHKDCIFNINTNMTGYVYPMGYDNINDVLTKSITITGNYNTGDKTFSLNKSSSEAILNCKISGLAANTLYQVNICFGDALNNLYKTLLSCSPTSDASGTANFVFIQNQCIGENRYHIIYLEASKPDESKFINLDKQTLEAKIYNITRTATGGTLTDNGSGTVFTFTSE